MLARIIPSGSLEQIIYRVDALHWIEKRGVPVMNSPRAIERSVDKFYTTALLQEAGLPTPETVVCEGATEAMAAVAAMGDVIIKPIFGSMGHGMVRVSDPDVAFRVVRSLEQLRTVFYVQRAVDHGGRDIRVFVVGGRVLGAIERRAPDGEWRTNVSLGGSARPFELPPAWEQLALRAAAAIGADYAGVDLLPSRDGTVFVLEVNGIPGWQGLQAGHGHRRRGSHRGLPDGSRTGGKRRGRPRRGTAGMTHVISCRELVAADVAGAAQLACLLEASAPKPGNVSPGRHFADVRYEDFLASAVAIGEPLAGAGTRTVGATVRLAIEATARWTRSNTNLGIVLLLTPIARAALLEKGDGSLFPAPDEQNEGQTKAGGNLLPASEKRPVPFFLGLRNAVRRVLEATTVADARDVYAAIRRAATRRARTGARSGRRQRADNHIARGDAAGRRPGRRSRASTRRHST